jgi:hypothetical protein
MKDMTCWIYNTRERIEKCMKNFIRKKEKDGWVVLK